MAVAVPLLLIEKQRAQFIFYHDEISIKTIRLIHTTTGDNFCGYTMCQNSKNENYQMKRPCKFFDTQGNIYGRSIRPD